MIIQSQHIMSTQAPEGPQCVEKDFNLGIYLHGVGHFNHYLHKLTHLNLKELKYEIWREF